MRILVDGLISGNFRRWGPPQYAQYQRFLGHCQFVGIELEINDRVLDLAQEAALGHAGFLSSWENRGSKQLEIQTLFEVKDPKTFYASVEHRLSVLRRLNIPTIGGTHVNVQCLLGKSNRSKIVTRTSSSAQHADIIGDGMKHYREEFKGGPVWTCPKELIGGILVITSKRQDIAYYLDERHPALLFSYVHIWDVCYRA